MNNYKIKVNNEAESREAQELFFELGFKWGSYHQNISYLDKKYIYTIAPCGLFYGDSRESHDTDKSKEITLPQLRDIVVLKRNKIEDATHIRCDGKKYLHAKSTDCYYQFSDDGEWLLSTWMSYQLLPQLKPISEQKMASHNIEQQELKANPKLFLDPTQNYAEIEWDGSFMKQDHWVEVSDYANYLYVSDCGEKTWTVRPRNSYGQLVWQRTQDEPFFTPESVLPQGIDATLAERQSTYGDFVYVANTTGKLFAEIKNGKNAHMLPYAHEEALHMICSKMARIVNGDCNHKDSWHDIAGYAKLIENLIKD